MESIRVAFAQPRNLQRSWTRHWPIFFDETAPPERNQLIETARFIREAVAANARLVVFPEIYPGPENKTNSAFTDAEVMAVVQTEAKAGGIWVFTSVRDDDGSGGTYNQTRVVSPKGELVARYNKLIPASNEPNTPGTEPLIVDCDGLKVGVMICWEMWYPEVARILRMKGADLIVAPTGGIVYELTSAWETVLRARALENNCYVGMTLNVFGVEDGLCELAGPEGTTAKRKREGLLIGDLDMARLRYMQETDETIIVPKPYHSVPGLLRWLRRSVVEHYAEAANAVVEDNEARTRH